MIAFVQAQESPLLPVIVLTGFLGSGKTTLLAELLRQKAFARTAVIINEFGEIGLDHDLIRTGSQENTILLDNGCVCCTLRSSLADTLRDLFLQQVKGKIARFDRVIIETTGLADPAPVLAGLMQDPVVIARFQLQSIIAMIDAVNADAQMDVHPEAVKQAAIADRLILSKTDLAAPAMTQRILARLQAINPAITPIQVLQGRIDGAELLGTARAGSQSWLGFTDEHDHAHDHAHDHHHEHGHDDGIRSFCLRFDHPLDPDSMAGLLEQAIERWGDKILRLKGILDLAGSDQPMVIHGVHHLLHPWQSLAGWPDGPRQSRLVFITQDLSAALLAQHFAARSV